VGTHKLVEVPVNKILICSKTASLCVLHHSAHDKKNVDYRPCPLYIGIWHQRERDLQCHDNMSKLHHRHYSLKAEEAELAAEDADAVEVATEDAVEVEVAVEARQVELAAEAKQELKFLCRNLASWSRRPGLPKLPATP